METKWAPGKWRTAADCVYDGDGNQIADFCGEMTEPEQDYAHASLFAAAPALYEALERLMRELKDQLSSEVCDVFFDDTAEAMEQARAALAAAVGEG